MSAVAAPDALARARAALHQGDLAAATEALNGAAATVAERRLLARARLLAGDLPGAEAALTADADDPAVTPLLARIRAEQARLANDPAAARAQLEPLLTQDPLPDDPAATAQLAAALATLAEVGTEMDAAEIAQAAAARATAIASGGGALAAAWARIAAVAADTAPPPDPDAWDPAGADAEATFHWYHAVGERAARAERRDTAKAAYDRALVVLRRLFSSAPEADRARFLQTHARRRFASNLLRLSAPDAGALSVGAPGRVEARLRGEEDLTAFEALAERVGDGEPHALVERLRDRFRDLLRLQEIGMALTAELDAERLLALIMDRAIEISGAERGFLLLREGERTRVAVARNVDNEDVQRPEWKVSHSIADEVARTGLPLIAANARADQRFDAYGSVHDLGLRSVLCVPLRVRGRMLGTLYLDNRFRESAFGPDAVTVVQAFADHAAVALDNARLHQETLQARAEVEQLNARLSELNRELSATVASQSVELDRARIELRTTRRDANARFGDLVGRSAAMQEVFALLDKVAETDAPVVIEGESGTGKELAAQAIHGRSPRHTGPFVPENCGAIPDALFESNFFGHVKGAFTGAHRDAPGLFVLADGGTLFLDEISGLAPDMQKKLLRVLQEGEVRPVGGTAVRPVNVRIIAASNQPLAELVRDGGFREDLFFRLNVLHVRLPPLRDRRDDIPLLVAHFLGIDESALAERITPAALDLLTRWRWPGNVRELENVVARMSALGRNRLDVEVVPDELRQPAPAADANTAASLAGRTLDQLEHDVISAAIRAALAEADNVKARAAEILGIPKSSLYNKMKKYGISG